jgi:hypothetical protein
LYRCRLLANHKRTWNFMENEINID